MRLQSSDPIFACHNTLPATKMTRMIVMSRVTDDDFDDHGDRDTALFFVFPSINRV